MVGLFKKYNSYLSRYVSKFWREHDCFSNITFSVLNIYLKQEIYMNLLIYNTYTRECITSIRIQCVGLILLWIIPYQQYQNSLRLKFRFMSEERWPYSKHFQRRSSAAIQEGYQSFLNNSKTSSFVWRKIKPRRFQTCFKLTLTIWSMSISEMVRCKYQYLLII